MRKPEDAIQARSYLRNRAVQRAVVVGGGFIGLEIAENLLAQGVAVTVVDFAGQVLPNVFDAEIADYVQRHLEKKKIRVLTGTGVERLNGERCVTSVTTSAGELPADLVVLSVGIRPNTEFLQGSGLEMVKGAIVTGKGWRRTCRTFMRWGLCVGVQPYYGRTAVVADGLLSKPGRAYPSADYCGGDKAYPGVLGTGVVKLPGLNGGRTGLTEAQAPLRDMR